MESEIKELTVRHIFIPEKNPRELVMLQGSGCGWRKCRFCDYHLDYCTDANQAFNLNQNVLSKITGKYKTLEIINSGSCIELDINTQNELIRVCKEKDITNLHFEAAWMYTEQLKKFRKKYTEAGFKVKMRIGVETFDYFYRESMLVKGIPNISPLDIRKHFEECNILVGCPGQTVESMRKDIDIALEYFDRICINVLVSNGMAVKADPTVVKLFIDEILSDQNIRNDSRIDILLENSEWGDWGIGGVLTKSQENKHI